MAVVFGVIRRSLRLQQHNRWEQAKNEIGTYAVRSVHRGAFLPLTRRRENQFYRTFQT